MKLTKPRRNDLTKTQKANLRFLEDFYSKYGYMPSTIEMARLRGYSCPNSASCAIKALKRKGYLVNGIAWNNKSFFFNREKVPLEIDILRARAEDAESLLRRVYSWISEQKITYPGDKEELTIDIHRHFVQARIKL